MMQVENLYDVIIIGGGPIGLACALEAKLKRLSYVILEKGCLVNSLYHYPQNMTFFSTSERLEIGGIPFVSNSPKPTRNEALEYYRRVAVSSHLNIHLFEEVLEIKKNEVDVKNEALKVNRKVLDLNVTKSDFELITSKQKYQTKNIIIASGFYDIPYLLNVKGEDLPKVTHYYKEPHFYAFQKVLVVGANNSAVDAALETWRKGAAVTMVIREGEIGKRVKYWARPDIVNRIEEGSIKAYFNSTIGAIRDGEVDIKTPGGLVTVENDWVIAMTGYQPDLSFLRKAGIHLSTDEIKKPMYDEDTHETNVKGIYLAGVVCGGMNTHSLFIENSREHAIRIIRQISSFS
jgi:thioredoxin reductase (NADPH)